MKNKITATRESLIAAGVRNLKDFGYGHVTPENIITDEVYGRFFLSMLENYPTIPDAVSLAKEIREKV